MERNSFWGPLTGMEQAENWGMDAQAGQEQQQQQLTPGVSVQKQQRTHIVMSEFLILTSQSVFNSPLILNADRVIQYELQS